MGKVQLGFCSLSIDESVWGGRRRIWPMGGGGFEANQAIQGTFFPRSSSARRGSRSHGDLLQQRIQIFMTLSGGLREMPFALFSQCSLYLKKTTNFHFQGIISILTQIIGALVLRDSWLCQYGMNAKGLLPGTFALQCIGHQSLWGRTRLRPWKFCLSCNK